MILIGIFAGVSIAAGALLHLGMFGVVPGVLAAVLYYVRDVKRHQRVPCRVCTGSGDEHSRLGGGGWFRRPFGNCWCCGGRKSHPRLALRIIDPAAHERIKNEIERAKGKP
jgi:hypothetical protein